MPEGSTLVLVLDLCGTFVFAISGAVTGVRKRLDIFGVLVLSFVAGNFGGITRDVLIGAVPPAALKDWRYITVSVLAGLAVFQWYPLINRVRTPTLVFDAAGLAFFAVSGAQKTLGYHAGAIPAVLLGMLTGIGGGMVRDVLAAEIPTVLRAELYAVAALAGAATVVIGDRLGLPAFPVAVAGAALCFGLRFIAIWRGWQLPTARPQPSEQPSANGQAKPDEAEEEQRTR